MPTGETWSREEVEATVADYMAMLRLELSGQPYNKAAHRRGLLARLSGRSEAAVELKHQNISAVLRDLGYFWIPGYKPRANYQALLASAVDAWTAGHPEIDLIATVAAHMPSSKPDRLDFASFETAPPDPVRRQRQGNEAAGTYGPGRAVGTRRDYVAQEARNVSLGTAGEELVVLYEQYRLSRLGQDRLAGKVEHLARTQGDGAGFDILSFEVDGREKFIEVKTTAFAKETPFFASAAEIRFSQAHAGSYAVYRLFEFRKQPKCFTLPGPIQDHCALEAVSFRCSFR